MKVLMINSVCGIRSTGRICTDLAAMLEAGGHEVKIAYGRDTVPEQYQKYAIRIGSDLDVRLHGVKARLTDASGFGSAAATRRFIQWIRSYDPDIIHLHNIHGYYLNVEILFDYLCQCKKPILWSFYDCWSFTGHCAHFDYNGCQQWQTGCQNCKHIDEYPKSFFDRSKRNFKRKKRLFTNISNLHLIVPSQWMAQMVSQSYMNKYPIHVLPNGIDIHTFHPCSSDFRERNGVEDRFLVMGAASVWQKMKGIEYFNRLAQELPEEKYRVMLVGNIPEGMQVAPNILRIPNTNSIEELCRLYTAADVFVNPTLQETQGLTTVEAFACGTPAVVFDAGGAAECVDNSCGVAVEKNNYVMLRETIAHICENQPLSQEKCRQKAIEYDKNVCYRSFMKLYDMLKNRNEIC